MGMTNTQKGCLKDAMDEAARFLRKAHDAIDCDEKSYVNCKHTAAAKRASLDLTRALATFRRGHE